MSKSNLYIPTVLITTLLSGLAVVLIFVLTQPAMASVGSRPGAESDWIYVSFQIAGTLDNGLAFDDEDILSHKVVTGEWFIYFDGSDVGLGGNDNFDVDAFHRLPDGSLLFSFLGTPTIPGIGSVDDSDIIRFFPTSLGPTTAGTFEMYFDGSDVGLETAGEDIDAITLTADGRLVISTDVYYNVGLTGLPTNLLIFTPTSLGENTSGTWALALEGAAVGLEYPPGNDSEDIWGVWIDPRSNAIYLKTKSAFDMSGISGVGTEVFTCVPPGASLPVTSCATAARYWDGITNPAGTLRADALMVDPYVPGPIWAPAPGTAVFLDAVITPTVSYAGDRSLTMVVEARDANGFLATGYRGPLNIDPSVSTTGLPQGPIGGVPDYTFTEEDAGRHVFTNFGFNVEGTQTITITDRDISELTVTTNAVTVEPVWLSAAISPTAAFAGEPRYNQMLWISVNGEK